LFLAAALLALAIGAAAGIVARGWRRGEVAPAPSEPDPQAGAAATATGGEAPPPAPGGEAPPPAPAEEVYAGEQDPAAARIVVDLSALAAPDPEPLPETSGDVAAGEVRLGPLRLKLGQAECWSVAVPAGREGVLFRNATEPGRARYSYGDFPQPLARIAARVSVVAGGGDDPQVEGAGLLFDWSEAPGKRPSYSMYLLRPDGRVALLRQGPKGAREIVASLPPGEAPPARLLEAVALEGGGVALLADGQQVASFRNPRVTLGQRVGVVALGRGSYELRSFEAWRAR
jgi:hypothetical protein